MFGPFGLNGAHPVANLDSPLTTRISPARIREVERCFWTLTIVLYHQSTGQEGAVLSSVQGEDDPSNGESD